MIMTIEEEEIKRRKKKKKKKSNTVDRIQGLDEIVLKQISWRLIAVLSKACLGI